MDNPRYKGKKFIPNFVDPRAAKEDDPNVENVPEKAPRKPVGKAGAPGPRQRPQLAKQLPPPRNTAGMLNPTPLRDDPIYKESIFGIDITVRENNMRTTVQPATFGLIPTVETVWQEMVADNSNIQKEMLIEGVRYYATGLLWLRIIQLKKSNKQALTEAETMVSSLCDSTTFAIPSPIHLYLQALGTVKCSGTGQTLIPSFPPLPEAAILGYGGYFGNMDDETHNLYEEFPCLGTTGEGLRSALSDAPPGEYQSSLQFDDLPVNGNLQGYAPLTNRRAEAKNPFLNLGITQNEFPESVVDTGFNYDVMHMISNWFTTTKTFKIESLNVPMLASTGSQSQTVITRPQTTGATGAVRNVMGDIVGTSLIRESITTFGVAQYALFQLMKETAQNPRENESVRCRTWCCINFTANSPIPNLWIQNRNQRRETMPLEYMARRFETISENNNNLRKRVVERMVIAKR